MLGNATVVVVHTSTDTDVYGDDTSTTTETSLAGCAFDPGSSNERTDPRSPVISSSPTLYVTDPAAAVDANDRVRVDGRTYTVEGDPRRWTSPFTGRYFGMVVSLARWEQL